MSAARELSATHNTMPGLLRLTAVAATLLAGCGGGGPDELSATVYRATGALQCQGGGQSLASIQALLAAAGVAVHSASCGSDGLAHPALCGVPDGSIAIFEISRPQLPLALQAGFASGDGAPISKRTCGS